MPERFTWTCTRKFRNHSGRFRHKPPAIFFRLFHTGRADYQFYGSWFEQLWMRTNMFDELFPQRPKSLPLSVSYHRYMRVRPGGRSRIISAAEKLLIQKNAGVIGLVSSSRPVNSIYKLSIESRFLWKPFGGWKRQEINQSEQYFKRPKTKAHWELPTELFIAGDPSMTTGLSANEIEITTLANTDNESTLEGTTPYIIEGKVTQNETTLTDFKWRGRNQNLSKVINQNHEGDENSPFISRVWCFVVSGQGHRYRWFVFDHVYHTQTKTPSILPLAG